MNTIFLLFEVYLDSESNYTAYPFAKRWKKCTIYKVKWRRNHKTFMYDDGLCGCGMSIEKTLMHWEWIQWINVRRCVRVIGLNCVPRPAQMHCNLVKVRRMMMERNSMQKGAIKMESTSKKYNLLDLNQFTADEQLVWSQFNNRNGLIVEVNHPQWAFIQSLATVTKGNVC